jgi:hypothetical protein
MAKADHHLHVVQPVAALCCQQNAIATFAVTALDNHLRSLGRKDRRYGYLGDKQHSVVVLASFRNPPSEPGDPLDLVAAIQRLRLRRWRGRAWTWTTAQ